ncbi:uncharacterized protein LOC129938557 [Eupeodes corollae]|uniref:uncharacterized protein LOC129938557 n=1 Tax=Eupeodes corollae TaxID=290404 RepID=UPI002491A1CA|nr:uncharacterized protein LOC129938557 [Eupeodes corollae]
MKLLVGRYVLLVCISAVLVLAEDDVASEKPIASTPLATPTTTRGPIVDVVTEKLIKLAPESEKTTPSPVNKNPKVYSTPNVKENIVREIVVIHDRDGYHLDRDHHHHHEHDYHHAPPPRQPPPPPHHHLDHHIDHHHPPPPNYHHYPPPYAGYYPPHHHYLPYSHGIMPQAYATGALHPPPTYPYYPPPPGPYYNPRPMKPSATIIESTSTTSSSGQSIPKPGDLLNQGTDFLWNLFDKLGDVNDENQEQEVVAINQKPSSSSSSSSVQTSSSSQQMLPPTWYSTLKKKIMFRKRTV